MSDAANKAVFLSYASQDAEAARKICEALRSGGVEVWFDADGGLEHGDEWDQKIRKQIKECVLFIPVVSANTQAREEGYFRIEWELAAQRALGIASGVPFILPVVIDDTREPDALVPDRFRTVQWTRLRGGEVPPDVRARFLKLWSHRTGVLRDEAIRAQPVARGENISPSAPAPARGGRSILFWFGWAAMAAVVLFAAALLVFQLRRNVAPPPTAAAPSAPPVAPKSAAPLSEARQFAEKARALFDALDGTRDDYKLAEELIEKAKAKDGTDAEVCAAEAQLHERFIVRGWDTSDARRESARAATQRALRLDAKSFEARFAQAGLLAYTGREGEEKDRQLRVLRTERPNDQRVLRMLGSTLDRLGRIDEAVSIFDESAALPGGDPLALYNKSQTFWFSGRTVEANAAIQAAIAQRPFNGALLQQVWYQTILHGDLDGARATLNKIDPAQLLEDRAAFFGYYVELLARRGAAAIERITAVPHDWLTDSWYTGPRSLLVGDAYAMTGRRDAAAVEWRAALKLIEEKLGTSPNDILLLYHRAFVLAKLDRREEAERQFAVLLQMTGVDLSADKAWPTYVAKSCILLGRKTEAIRQIRLNLKPQRRPVNYTAAVLRLDPAFDPLRGEPEFARVIAELEALEKAAVSALPGPQEKITSNEKSVAVLAFENRSEDKANEYFSDGIADELLTTLQKIPGLKVAAHTSAWSFKGKNATTQEIGEKLGVAHLVEGSVQKSGNRVKITARLSRAATNEEVWSKSFGPLELTDVFATQSELAQAIVAELRGRLGGATVKTEIQAQVQAAAKGGTKNPEAHQLYLQGKFFGHQFSLENLVKASGFFRRAVELDPEFALAWAALGRAEAVQGEYDTTERGLREHYAAAREACQRALALEPDLAETQLALFEIQIGYDFDWRGARESVRRARALAPSDALVIHDAAQLARFFGEIDKALELGRQAVALDPVNPEIHHYLGGDYALAGRFAEAEGEHRRALELSPDVPYGHGNLAGDLDRQGKLTEALAEAEKEPADWARFTTLAFVYWDLKNPAKADEALKNLIDSSANIAACQVAQVYAQRGEKDLAFQWLERAYRQHDAGLAFSKLDTNFARLSGDPRWDVFLKKLGLSDEQLK